MDTVLERQFSAMGARVKHVGEFVHHRRLGQGEFSIDVRKDSGGEYFELASRGVEASVLDTDKGGRHLLLMTRKPAEQAGKPDVKDRYLCGHDERNWFVAAIPETRGVSTVAQAKQALKPDTLVAVESRAGVKAAQAQRRHRRLNDGTKVHRQGEFMFVPQPGFKPPRGSLTVIHRNEPMRGGGSHMHVCEELYREGGRTVWVRGAQTLEDKEFRELPRRERPHWRSMVEDMTVYARGKVRHEEHRTLDLGPVWHRVLISTEGKSRVARNVRFVD